MVALRADWSAKCSVTNAVMNACSRACCSMLTSCGAGRSGLLVVAC
jgi:hypothetical protein